MISRHIIFIAQMSCVFFSLTGAVNAQANYHDVVRDERGRVVRSTNGNCVRTQWETQTDPCVPLFAEQYKSVKKVTKETSLSQEARTVYFDFDKSTLTPAAKTHLNALIQALKSDQNIREAKLVGYADRIGDVTYNQNLSQRRAETVRNYLVASGYTQASVTDTQWVGETKPSTNCPVAKVNTALIECLHNDRRVEVVIVFAP